MEVITIAQRKGGTAKTATALNLGAGLHCQGKRILFIDLDSQANLTRNLRIDPEQVKRSAYDVLTGLTTAEQAIVKTTEGSLLPADARLAKLDNSAIGKEGIYHLRDALQAIIDRYDYVIIDTPPQMGASLLSALTASDKAIITAEARQSSIDGVRELYGAIEAVRSKPNKALQIEGILITRSRPRTILSRDMRENMEGIAEEIGTKVFTTSIRDCTAIAESEAMRQSIFEYAPRSNGAKDYNELITEILREEAR